MFNGQLFDVDIQKVFKFYFGVHQFHDGLYVVALGGDEVVARVGDVEAGGHAHFVFVQDVVENALRHFDVVVLVLVVFVGRNKVVPQLAFLNHQGVLGTLHGVWSLGSLSWLRALWRRSLRC